MNRWTMILLATLMGALAPEARGQTRPYIGFVYPAGGPQGTTFQVRIGGQGLNDVNAVLVSGAGVKARVIDYQRRLSPQDVNLLREQLGILRKTAGKSKGAPATADPNHAIRAKIERRLAEYVNRPACVSIANIALVEITLAPDAKPGEREIRLGTPTGVSNPMAFHVGQVREVSRPAMSTSEVQVLGKEEQALRRRPDAQSETRITLPCTVNGQIASGEVNRYRFPARQGQHLVIAALARQLVPFIADAVPGWFQPVLTLHDAAGRELAYVDDFRFKPDPVLFFEVPADGEYVFAIRDSIYRGREDFVYRITAGELPYLTGAFPLGAKISDPVSVKLTGVNLAATDAAPVPRREPGFCWISGTPAQQALNRVPFAWDTLPESLEAEPNDTGPNAQPVELPLILNGRLQRPGDRDVFVFAGRAGQTVVAEVLARRLDSPLDSMLRLTDAAGKVIAFNDDYEDGGSGLNTHHADSYLRATLPADGTYHLHLSDTAQDGGEEHGYRLRLSRPRPDFALRVVPSSIAIRGKSSAAVSVHVIRQDGFAGPVQVGLSDPPKGVTAASVWLSPTQQVAKLTVKADWAPPGPPVHFNLKVTGSALIEGRPVVRAAVPAEDRMQAFLWRHLVPAEELKVLVFNSAYTPPPKRIPRVSPAFVNNARTAAARAARQPFTQRQVAGRLRDLKLIFEEGLLTDEFYTVKVVECELAR